MVFIKTFLPEFENYTCCKNITKYTAYLFLNSLFYFHFENECFVYNV